MGDSRETYVDGNYSACQALGRVIHVVDPALMCNGRCRDASVEAEQECCRD